MIRYLNTCPPIHFFHVQPSDPSSSDTFKYGSLLVKNTKWDNIDKSEVMTFDYIVNSKMRYGIIFSNTDYTLQTLIKHNLPLLEMLKILENIVGIIITFSNTIKDFGSEKEKF